MIVRLGYVSISTTLNLSTSKNVTYTNFSKNSDYKLIDKTIKNNLENLIQILKYNVANNIHFYRISSSIIPLATHPDVNFDYLDNYQIFYDKISRIINDKKMRIDLHASNYCILNSTKKEVVDYSIKSLEYYYNLLKYMEVEDPLIILHIGSSVLGKENSIKRFINNFQKLPTYLKEIIAIENDDKVFNIEDIIKISKNLDIPIVLDYHHHLCNKKGDIENYLEDIFKSWKNKRVKMHFSSPQDNKNIRNHNDYINIDNFIDFLEIIRKQNQDVDIMIEAKAKDEALFRLIRQLKYKTNYKFIDETTFEL